MTKSDIQIALEKNPGDPIFVELAETLRAAGQLEEAMLVCLRGLSHNSGEHKGRLSLARIFFELGFLPFAAKEVQHLAAVFPDNSTLQRLNQKLSRADPDEVGSGRLLREGSADVVAEADFDVEDIEDLENENER